MYVDIVGISLFWAHSYPALNNLLYLKCFKNPVDCCGGNSRDLARRGLWMKHIYDVLKVISYLIQDNYRIT